MEDVRRTLTPQLRTDCGDTRLVLVDLGGGRDRLGGSCLAQVYGRVGGEAPDCDDPLCVCARSSRRWRGCAARACVLAYHDRSDGGLFVTLCEMAFAGRCGIEVGSRRRGRGEPRVAALFAEELGAVLQVDAAAEQRVLAMLHEAGLGDCVRMIGRVHRSGRGARPVSRPRAVLGDAHRAAPGLVGDELPHAVAARQPGVRATRSTRARRIRRTRGCTRA